MTATSPDLLTLLETRRSVKIPDLVAPGPTAAELDRLLTIASRVPDHGKLTPWRFIVFEGDARLRAGEALASIFAVKEPRADADRLAMERARLARAPLVVAVVSKAGVHPKIPEWEQILSSGAAAMNLVIAANAMGYGTNWITEWYAYDAAALAALGVAEGERVAGFIHIGTAAQRLDDRPRPALSDIVTRF